MSSITEDKNSNIITFEWLQKMKLEHAELNKSADSELLNYLYEILDNINSEIIKQNKQRIKAKYGSLLPPSRSRNETNVASTNSAAVSNESSNKRNGIKRGGGKRNESSRSGNYRSSGNPSSSENSRFTNSNSSTLSTGGPGILSQLLGSDRVKLAINRELNKLSPTNMDVIIESITDVFGCWLLDELNADSGQEILREKFKKYIGELWYNLIGKSLSQPNMSEVYFKFLRKIMNNPMAIINNLKSRSPVMATKLSAWCPEFSDLTEFKETLIGEIIKFLSENSYFDIEVTRLGELVGNNNLNNIMQAFTILGLFTKYFMDQPGRNRNMPSSWDIMLLAIYDNFKLLNELLYWEPINLEDVERRVFFIVGFLEDNRGFIQNLDTDFYRDIECELDSIKKCASIPTTVKYKLFDCIDNFIQTRKSGSRR